MAWCSPSSTAEHPGKHRHSGRAAIVPPSPRAGVVRLAQVVAPVPDRVTVKIVRGERGHAGQWLALRRRLWPETGEAERRREIDEGD